MVLNDQNYFGHLRPWFILEFGQLGPKINFKNTITAVLNFTLVENDNHSVWCVLVVVLRLSNIWNDIWSTLRNLTM